MISDGLLDAARCPDCRARIDRGSTGVRCDGCGRVFDSDRGFLDLRPTASFQEQTKYLDEALHADARHESIAPPVLGSKVRNDMLRRFLRLEPGDRVVDLGCGNGRAIAWNRESRAAIAGIDISPYFAAEAIEAGDLVLGDLRALPFQDGAFEKAWSLDVLEHLSPQALRDVLTEANRVLEPGGHFFVYTHVRKNGWIAGGVRAVNRLAGVAERAGLLDLRQERLRKSDHLNPLADHADLHRVAGACGFRVARITYYTPIIGAFVENILARMVEHRLVRRAQRSSSGTPGGAADASRTARLGAQARVRRKGLVYLVLLGATLAMKADVLLFGRIPSGPFFALLEKQAASENS